MKTFYDVLIEMKNLYERKNGDYGDSFSKSIEKYGYVAGLVRISDKFNRLENLIMGATQNVNDESVRDTLIDLANYSVMLIAEMDNETV